MNDRAREVHGVDPGDVVRDGELLAEFRAERERVLAGGEVAPWVSREDWLAEVDAQIARLTRGAP